MSSPFERYMDYVFKLETEGGKFPANQYGDLNFTKIGIECGNRRQWFSENSEKVFSNGQTLKQIIAADIKRVGTTFVSPKNYDDELLKETEISKKENSKFKQQILLLTKENELLRSENEQLKKVISENEIHNEELSQKYLELSETGRRFVW